MDPMTDEEYRQQAKALFEQDGEIEIDDDAQVIRAHDHPEGRPCHNADAEGAYVAAWVWVPEEGDSP